jgi:hypothetical protein
MARSGVLLAALNGLAFCASFGVAATTAPPKVLGSIPYGQGPTEFDASRCLEAEEQNCFLGSAFIGTDQLLYVRDFNKNDIKRIRLAGDSIQQISVVQDGAAPAIAWPGPPPADRSSLKPPFKRAGFLGADDFGRSFFDVIDGGPPFHLRCYGKDGRLIAEAEFPKVHYAISMSGGHELLTRDGRLLILEPTEKGLRIWSWVPLKVAP